MKQYIFVLIISSMVSIQAMDSFNDEKTVKTELIRLLDEGNLDAFCKYVDEIVKNSFTGSSNLDNALRLAVEHKVPAAVKNVLPRCYWMKDDIELLYSKTLKQELPFDYKSIEARKIRAVRAYLQVYLDGEKAQRVNL